MPEVSWQARRTTDNVLVDVTADVDGLPQGAPVGNPIEGGATEQTVLSRTVTLTNTQIKALPTTAVVIVPATEVLNYTGVPTSLAVPVHAYAVLDNSAAGYTNVQDPADLRLVIGSDNSATWADAHDGTLGYAKANVFTSLPTPDVYIYGFAPFVGVSLSNQALQDAIYDNAIAIAANNGVGGNFTGGNAANTMKVVVLYTSVDL